MQKVLVIYNCLKKLDTFFPNILRESKSDAK